MPARAAGRATAVGRPAVGVVLDAGALIEIEGGARWMIALLAEIAAGDGAVVLPAAALAQVWRGPSSARVARVIKARETHVVAFDAVTAYAVGEILARAGSSDVVDASVVLAARAYGHPIVTSDVNDLRLLDPSASLFRADTGTPG